MAFNPPAGIPRELYIPDLAARLAQIGSGSTYVIAELDGAYTKYYEATLESEWRGAKTFVRGSYTWSHYYGNFDQDNSTRRQRRSTSSSAPRTSRTARAASSGTSRTATCAATGRTC